MREAVELARTVGKRLGDKDPIFKDLEFLGRVEIFLLKLFLTCLITIYVE